MENINNWLTRIFSIVKQTAELLFHHKAHQVKAERLFGEKNLCGISLLTLLGWGQKEI